MKSIYNRAYLIALLTSASLSPLAAHAASKVIVEDGVPEQIVITGQRHVPNVPTTTEGVTAEALGRAVNVVTPEDTLRYVPNILIRQRHIGDTQSPVTTRTSGVGASARSLIYVDGILLSSLIGNNNTSASPKWGLIQPDAVSRIDVLYGPFSAAYAGNSMGSVIEFTTRMPSKLEGSLDIQGADQSFKKYGDDKDYGTGRFAATLGDRNGRFAWRIGFNHLDSSAQPLTYATATLSTKAGTANPVTGAFFDANRTGAPVIVYGATALENQVQDNASGRFTYDVAPNLTAAYTIGLFENTDRATDNSYLRDASGNTVYTGTVSIGGKTYTLANSAFSSGVYSLDERQLAQGLSLASHGGGAFDFSLTASSFDYLRSHQRIPTGALPAAFAGGAGTDAVLDGTGWMTFDAKGIWRPQGAHTVTFGLHQDDFKLENPKYTVADWTGSDDAALAGNTTGRTETRALWAQDMMQIGPRTRLTSGIRFEDWRAYDGLNYSATPALNVIQPELKRSAVSPKVVLAFMPRPEWTLKASMGAATRFPTVSELYQAVTTGTVLSVPNPNLKPERDLSTELSAERVWPDASLRVSVFGERVANALVSQSAPLVSGSTTLYSYVQNVDRTTAAGIELVGDKDHFLIPTLQLSGWLTYVRAKTDKDLVLPAAVGKDLPQLPRLRGSVVLTWSPTAKWDVTLAGRYSDRAFGTIDNSDTYANTYQGFSGFFVMDTHVRYRVDAHWTAEAGVDNLNNRSYFLYHPFTQRTVIFDLKYNL